MPPFVFTGINLLRAHLPVIFKNLVAFSFILDVHLQFFAHHTEAPRICQINHAAFTGSGDRLCYRKIILRENRKKQTDCFEASGIIKALHTLATLVPPNFTRDVLLLSLYPDMTPRKDECRLHCCRHTAVTRARNQGQALAQSWHLSLCCVPPEL